MLSVGTVFLQCQTTVCTNKHTPQFDVTRLVTLSSADFMFYISVITMDSAIVETNRIEKETFSLAVMLLLHHQLKSEMCGFSSSVVSWVVLSTHVHARCITIFLHCSF